MPGIVLDAGIVAVNEPDLPPAPPQKKILFSWVLYLIEETDNTSKQN